MRVRLWVLFFLAAFVATGYTYDSVSQNPMIEDTYTWRENGNVYFDAPGVFLNGGSLLYYFPVSGANPNDYELASTLYLGYGTGATWIHLLRASGTFTSGFPANSISAEISIPTPFTGAATLNIKQTVNGSVSLLGSTAVTVADGASVRTVIFGTNLWVFINNMLVATQTLPSLTTGAPGLAGAGTSNAACFSTVSVGPHFTGTPAAIVSSNFASSIYPTNASMKWGASNDGAGPGVAQYYISRNGSLIGSAVIPEYEDLSVQPSNSYTYAIQAVDFHGNLSAATNFSITTPSTATGPGAAPNSADPRRVGVRANGSYWGGGGEQLDTQSGNLSYSLPLLKAQGRTGWMVPVNLVYNSQNWRQDNGTNWQLGYDVGFGFGWKVLIGAVTPVYGTVAGGIDHYVFTDASGAEYRLDQNSGGVWSSQQGINFWFDANANRLHFKDGAFWAMGSTSGGTEADAGTMYPTVMEDVNGNQVLVTYDVGKGLPATSVNTSARITRIEDSRAPVYCTYNTTTCTPGTYQLTYDGASPVSHLTSFANQIGTAEAGTFSYSTAILSPPFGADPGYYGKTTAQLAGYAIGGIGTYQFAYDWTGSQELTQVTFPWGGHLRWSYAAFSYAGGRILREVSGRYLAVDSAGATEWSYGITHPDAANSVTTHSGMTLTDASGNGAKTWSLE